MCQSARAEVLKKMGGDVELDEYDKIELKILAVSLSHSIKDKMRNSEYGAQTFYLPLSGDGMLITGQVVGVERVHIGYGHSC